ncbi:efflux RND transporter permease subunit [Magnetovirga frankeli]|uniref:efflux RND transporter permease subunit n=1 Tax=Magnetovirga frankeli TaxID=947516 RepID=UPI001293354A|nr:efflux RND transporter permease subunit [gamma proteobacterium SS-5]
MNLAQYSLLKAPIAWLLCLLLLLGGFISYQGLGRFEDPEFVIRQAVVTTPYAGALPSQVADEVTDVLETALQQMQEVKEITSISRQGSSQVKVEIALPFAGSQAELEQVWDKLRRKVADAQRRLPPGAGPSVVNDDFGDVYALFFAVTGEGYSLSQIRDYVEDLEQALQQVPGVARVATLGAPEEVIFVEISDSKAAQLGIPLEQIHQALRQFGLTSAAGDLRAGSQRLQIQPSSRGDSLAAMEQILLASADGRQLVRLKDLASLSRGYREPPRVLLRYDGQPAIGLGISNVKGGNVVSLGDRVRERLAQLEEQRPIGMELNITSYQSDSVRAAVEGFVDNLIAALLIVVLVLVIFMGWRSGLIVGAVLLLTVAATLIAMYLDDIAMQRISLGALIIALGMLVDNAIVITDGILVRLQRGEAAIKAAVEVVSASQWPLLGGTLVGILAFSAIGLSPTDMGEYAGSLFWVILYSMLFSWLFAVTLTPLFCVRFLRVKSAAPGTAPGTAAAPLPVWMRQYAELLRWMLRRRLLSGLALLTLLLAALFGFGYVPPGFMPESARPQFVVDVYLPQGSDIQATADVLAQIETQVAAKPGVSHITSFIGQGGLRFMLSYTPEDPNSSYGQLLVDVTDARQIDALVAQLQEELGLQQPDAQIKVWKFMLGRGGGKKIEAAFQGPDPQVLRKLGDQAKAIMAEDPAALAIQDDWRQRVPLLRPQIDAQAVERAGLDSQMIRDALQRSFGGSQIGLYAEGDRLLPIISRPPPAESSRADDLANVLLFSPRAERAVPLSQLVSEVSLVWEDALIRRIDGVPTLKAQADPAPGELAGNLLQRLRPQLEAMPLPPGYELHWHGEYKASQEANQGLALSAPYGFGAMLLAVVIMFNAYRQPLVIWLTAPLALLGVTLGLLLFQAPFEFMAILGFLSLIGMLVKNAIVLVDQADVEIRDGKPGFQAVLDAAVSRARPVFLGALTTILGVAPLLADPFFKSMAVTIMFGLAFATLLTLLVVPLLYVVLFGLQEEQG